MKEHSVVISLGTNLGDKLKNLKNALSNIEGFGSIINKSRIFCSDPWGYNSENEFLNMGLVIKTSLEPMQLLKKLKTIERQMGRGPKMVQSYQPQCYLLLLYIYFSLNKTTFDSSTHFKSILSGQSFKSGMNSFSNKSLRISNENFLSFILGWGIERSSLSIVNPL